MPVRKWGGLQLALIDCNNFYVSCERAFQPYLQRKAGVVLSNNDGCAIARSQEAKELGIKMGAPYFQLKELYVLPPFIQIKRN